MGGSGCRTEHRSPCQRTRIVLLQLYLCSAQIPGFKPCRYWVLNICIKAACPGSSHGSPCVCHPMPRAYGCPKQGPATVSQYPPGCVRARVHVCAQLSVHEQPRNKQPLQPVTRIISNPCACATELAGDRCGGVRPEGIFEATVMDTLFPQFIPGAGGCQPCSGHAGGFHAPGLGLPSTISPIERLLPAHGAILGQISQPVHDISRGTLCPSGTKAVSTFLWVFPFALNPDVHTGAGAASRDHPAGTLQAWVMLLGGRDRTIPSQYKGAGQGAIAATYSSPSPCAPHLNNELFAFILPMTFTAQAPFYKSPFLKQRAQR